MNLIDSLKWRYATKKYDNTKKVSAADIAQIVEAARLAPTSSGMQQFRVLVISNPELKEKIVPIASGQRIVSDCSHLLVFAAWDKYTEERIDSIYQVTTTERGLKEGHFNDYTNRLKAAYLQQTPDENFVHTAKQAYIGLGLAIAAAAELKVDSTPMEGFNNAALDELLGLREQGLKSVLLLPVGYRDAANDWLVNMKKVRNAATHFATYIE